MFCSITAGELEKTTVILRVRNSDHLPHFKFKTGLLTALLNPSKKTDTYNRGWLGCEFRQNNDIAWLLWNGGYRKQQVPRHSFGLLDRGLGWELENPDLPAANRAGDGFGAQ